jgi:glycosyltransferase involved in cell wall biosynthesis
MKIIVAVRCYNEEKHIERFMRGYDFADQIIVSDGGSTDRSVELLKQYSKVTLLHFTEKETRHGHTWNPDAPHMNFVLDAAKAEKPDWLIFDDMDCMPNSFLRNEARSILEVCGHVQVNAFRLYLWGDTGNYFPKMNDYFNPDYTSLWAWKPEQISIYADMNVRHGTIVGTTADNHKLHIPHCLLHRSWYPDTIESKVEHYNKLGLPMNHPLSFAGELVHLPEWAHE